MLPRSTEIRRVVSLFVYSNKYVYMLLGWNQINVYIVYIIYKVNSLDHYNETSLSNIPETFKLLLFMKKLKPRSAYHKLLKKLT